jgi:hypothetical protein
MFGPNGAGKYTGTFKIVKSHGSKNWRLNGTLVDDPIEEPGRFDVMRPGDIAVMAFDGRPEPHEIGLVLLAQDVTTDRALWEFFVRRFPPRGRNTMPVLRSEQIAEAMREPGVPADHPLRLLILDPDEQAALEDIAQGGSKGARKLADRRGAPVVTPEKLAAAKAANERTGAIGEALVARHFDRQRTDYDWVSSINSVASHDFLVRAADGDHKLDVKSTKGAFTNDFHLSLGEIYDAARSSVPYFIYRAFGVTDAGASCRISDDIRPLAQRLVAAHTDAMFDGITADSFSVPVTAVAWGEVFELLPADDDDAEPDV